MKKKDCDHIKLGVTGRMGAGKSTLCRALVNYGIKKDLPVFWIEADSVRRLFAPGPLQIPSMISSLKKQIAAHARGILLVEWAMLAEHDLLADVDFNVCNLLCDDEILYSRLSGGDLPQTEIKKRLSAQMTDSRRKAFIKDELKKAGCGNYVELDTSSPLSPGAVSVIFNSFCEASE